MDLNKLENKRQALELKFSKVSEQIDTIEFLKYELEEIETQQALLSGSNDFQFNEKYNDKMCDLDAKIYKLEDKQGEIQDKIDIVMEKLNITY